MSCRKGEVSKEVFETSRLDTYREAAHKPFVIAAMILRARFPDATDRLEKRLRKES